MAHLTLSEGTFAAAESRLGKRSEVTIGHNTILHRDGPDAIAVRLHATNVLTFTRDGWTIIRTNGWDTPTTRDRVNALLPAGWHVGGDGKGYRGKGWGLYRTGPNGWARVADFADGISVRQDASDRSVGMTGSRWQNTPVAIILTGFEVLAIASQAEADKAAREAKRATRLARQHEGEVALSVIREWGDKVAEAVEADREPLALHVAQFEAAVKSPHGRGNAWDCLKCRDREAIAREYRQRIMAAQHDNGKHVKDEVTRTYPLMAEGESKYPGQRDFSAEPKVTTATVAACPWDCPKRAR